MIGQSEVVGKMIRDRQTEIMKGGNNMNMATVMAVIALVLIVFFAVRYIVKEKKKGTKCIGCPMAGQCEKFKNNDSCS